MTFEFKKIPGFENYEINSDGTVVRNIKTGQILRQQVNDDMRSTKYLYVKLCKNGKGHHCYIHQLVARCWLGKKPEGLTVDHIDRNQFNNYYRNLRYVTYSEQLKNRGKYSYGEIGRQKAKKRNVERTAIQITLKLGDEIYTFESMASAAKTLHLVYENCSATSLYYQLVNRNCKIFDFEVFYKERMK